jgi:hypothetical protein
VESRRLEVQKATLDLAGTSRLEEIRRAMSGGATAGQPAVSGAEERRAVAGAEDREAVTSGEPSQTDAEAAAQPEAEKEKA